MIKYLLNVELMLKGSWRNINKKWRKCLLNEEQTFKIQALLFLSLTSYQDSSFALSLTCYWDSSFALSLSRTSYPSRFKLCSLFLSNFLSFKIQDLHFLFNFLSFMIQALLSLSYFLYLKIQGLLLSLILLILQDSNFVVSP